MIEQYGKLTVVEHKIINHRHIVLVSCNCNKYEPYETRFDEIKAGRTTSCGCTRGVLKHGKNTRNSTEYRIWASMLQRCYNPKNINYIWYGFRGITVCERWLKFENFFADMGLRPNSLSLDRIDNNRNYEKDNCKWSTKKEQMQNKRQGNQYIQYG